MLRGVKRIQGEADKAPKFPVTLALLELIEPLVDPANFEQCLLFAAWCVASGGLLRLSEFTAFKDNAAPLLCNKHLLPATMDGGYYYRVLHLEASKADPFRHGVQIVLGHSSSRANALNAFAAYDRLRSPAARSADAPLFAFRNGSPLSKTDCTSCLRAATGQLKMDTSRFRGFSFRRGGAQSLRDAGVQA